MKISTPGFSNRWLFIDLLNLFLAYLETPTSFIVLIFIYGEKRMGQLRVLLITSQFQLLDVVLLCWKQAVAMKAATLENTWWFITAHTHGGSKKLYWSLIEKEVI